MQIITRAEAKAAGKTRYFTGNPCPKGHIVQRTVASKDCVRCALDRCSRLVKANPEKHRASGLRWKTNNPEAYAIISRRAQKKQREKDPKKLIALTQKWRLDNPEKVKEAARKWRDKNVDSLRQKTAIRTRNWRERFPEKRRSTDNRRRSRKNAAEGHYSSGDILETLLRQKHQCCGINCLLDISKCYSVDHIIPLSRGGSNWPTNIQLLCKSCNSKKGTKTMEEWRAYYFQTSSGTPILLNSVTD